MEIAKNTNPTCFVCHRFLLPSSPAAVSRLSRYCSNPPNVGYDSSSLSLYYPWASVFPLRNTPINRRHLCILKLTSQSPFPCFHRSSCVFLTPPIFLLHAFLLCSRILLEFLHAILPLLYIFALLRLFFYLRSAHQLRIQSSVSARSPSVGSCF